MICRISETRSSSYYNLLSATAAINRPQNGTDRALHSNAETRQSTVGHDSPHPALRRVRDALAIGAEAEVEELERGSRSNDGSCL
jgi:hypothetical protein